MDPRDNLGDFSIGESGSADRFDVGFSDPNLRFKDLFCESECSGYFIATVVSFTADKDLIFLESDQLASEADRSSHRPEAVADQHLLIVKKLSY